MTLVHSVFQRVMNEGQEITVDFSAISPAEATKLAQDGQKILAIRWVPNCIEKGNSKIG